MYITQNACCFSSVYECVAHLAYMWHHAEEDYMPYQSRFKLLAVYNIICCFVAELSLRKSNERSSIGRSIDIRSTWTTRE